MLIYGDIMKLFIRRDVSPADTCFVIYDELGKEKYRAVLKKSRHTVNQNSIKLDIFDEYKTVVAKIRQLPIVGVKSYSLKTDNSAATLVIMTALNSVQCRFYGNNWHIIGNIADKEFSIIDVDNAVISAQHKQNSGYELVIRDSSNELISLLAALCINMINTVDNRAIQAV